MKVICAGFWKTGTKSMANALKLLGYRVYDFDDQLLDLPHLWENFFNGTVSDQEIREALEDVDVLIDGPVIAFWEEILRVFPDAKVILTIRDEDEWFKSYRNMLSIWWLRWPVMVLMFGGMLIPASRRFFHTHMGVAEFCLGDAGLFKLSFLTVPKSPRLCKLKFRKHNCYVRTTVKPEQLLEHRPGDEWGPLCKFLSKDVPQDHAFPYENKNSSLFHNGEFMRHPDMSKIVLQSLIGALVLFGSISYLIYCLLPYLLD